MRALILSDLHFHTWTQFAHPDDLGVNSRLRDILRAMWEAWENFRDAPEHTNEDVVIIAGDFFHVRGVISPFVLNPVFSYIKTMVEDGANIYIIAGNHDLATRETTALGNSAEIFTSLGCNVITRPLAVECGDTAFFLIPWYERLEDTRAQLASLSGKQAHQSVIIMHAPLNGVIKGIPDNGLDPEWVAQLGFKKVFVGHYHNHVEQAKGVISIGALTHQTWNDVGTKAGYIIYDSIKNTVEHYETKAPKFVDYDFGWEPGEAEVNCKGNYVRVSIEEGDENIVKEMRYYVCDELGALGCVFKSVPASAPLIRSTAISTASTLHDSIAEYLKVKPSKVDPEKLHNICLALLNEVDATE